jgi:hypothetical protein
MHLWQKIDKILFGGWNCHYYTIGNLIITTILLYLHCLTTNWQFCGKKCTFGGQNSNHYYRKSDNHCYTTIFALSDNKFTKFAAKKWTIKPNLKSDVLSIMRAAHCCILSIMRAACVNFPTFEHFTDCICCDFGHQLFFNINYIN